MKVLVTGGAGYIGSHTCVELLSAGHQVHVVDNFSTGHEEALNRVRKVTGCDVGFSRADIRDRSTLSAIFAQFEPEVVIHFAGSKAVGESISQPLDYYDNNVSGSVSLLEVMNEYCCTRIVFSSSATVYGEPQYLPLDEMHPTSPINPYGHSKLMVEQILKDWVNASRSRSAIVLRYFNPIGAHPSGLIGEDPKGIPNNLMPHLVQVFSGFREKLSIFGGDYKTKDGTGERDYIHVVDLASAHLKAIENGFVDSELLTYNIGTGKAYSVLDLVAAMRNVTKIKIRTEIVDRRSGDVANVWADAGLAKEKLNWVALLGIEDMCEDSWRWQEKNKKGYRDN